MKLNVHPDCMAIIARTFAVATIILRVMHKLVNVFAIKAGRVTIVQNHALRATTVWAAKRNVLILSMETRKHAITSVVITYAALDIWG